MTEQALKAIKERERLYLPVLAYAFNAAQLPPELGPALASHESNFKPTAINLKDGDAKRGGAYGLCQMTLQTARGLGFNGAPLELQGPNLNAQLAAQYCAQNFKRFDKDLWKTVAAYNCGPRHVLEGDVPKETAEHYVPAILGLMEAYREVCAKLLKRP